MQEQFLNIPEHFHITIIEEVSNQNELKLREQYWIRYYQANNSKFGYNETDALYKCGGNTYQNKSNAEMEKIKELIRQRKLGKNNPQAKRVKRINILTKEEDIYDSIIECKSVWNKKWQNFYYG